MPASYCTHTAPAGKDLQLNSYQATAPNTGHVFSPFQVQGHWQSPGGKAPKPHQKEGHHKQCTHTVQMLKTHRFLVYMKSTAIYMSLSLDMKPSILTRPTPSLILGKSSHRYKQGKMKPSLFYKGYLISLCWIKATRTSRTAHKYLCGRSTAGYDGLLGSLGQSRVTQQQLQSSSWSRR